MSSFIKAALFILSMISITLGGVYVKNSAAEYGAAKRITQIAPIVISSNGTVKFPERVPTPEAVFQIQTAVQTDDASSLNDLLIKHRFYVLPGRKKP